MKEQRILWAQSRARLADAVTSLGYSAELADLMAKQLGSPRAIDRMTSYIYQAHPTSEEMLVDEMLAICAEIDAWRQKKAGQTAQAYYSNMRFFGKIGMDEDETDKA